MIVSSSVCLQTEKGQQSCDAAQREQEKKRARSWTQTKGFPRSLAPFINKHLGCKDAQKERRKLLSFLFCFLLPDSSPPLKRNQESKR